ncbi:hypothetical protein B5E53_10390 [Eubacterium sp. An11]|uniref:hypothetical protein n=1 Tax=Eubacterium sp. An11 TaxID=1965542 RepID=UPI000B39C52D|nr:hypothetical protein [Eubacterium sp. An11]OUQ66435.1 hypothetical protein B5E53_10390 [Eubacterium sp. An11]
MDREDLIFESEKYFLNLMKESKTSLYIRAGEIDCKKNFFQHLKEKEDMLEDGTYLGLVSDAADRFYLFFLEKYEKKLQDLYGRAAAEWLQEVFYREISAAGK